MPPTPSSRWAGRATSRFRCSSSAGPPARRLPWWSGASMLDALRRGLRGDFKGTRGRIALALTAVSWGLLGLRLPAQRAVAAVLREPAARGARRGLRSRRGARSGGDGVAGCIRTSWSRRQYVKKADIVRYGPHRANVADVWRRADLPTRRARRPVLLQVPGGAWAIGMRRPQALSVDEPHGRTRLGVSCRSRTGSVPATPGPRTSSTSSGRWRGSRSTSPSTEAIRTSWRSRAVRRAGTSRALAALTPNEPEWQPGFEDADTSVVAAVPIYGRYDWFTREGTVDPSSSGSCSASSSRSGSPRTGRTTWTRHRSPRCDRTRRRSSCCTARTTRSSRWARGASSSRRSRRSRTTGGLCRDPARAARVRLLRLAARSLHRGGGGALPGLGEGHHAG